MKLFRDKKAEAMVWKCYKALELLTNDIELLGAVGSFRDTLSDDECLEFIDDWINKKRLTP